MFNAVDVFVCGLCYDQLATFQHPTFLLLLILFWRRRHRHLTLEEDLRLCEKQSVKKKAAMDGL